MSFARDLKHLRYAVKIDLFIENTPIAIVADADSLYNTKVTGKGARQEFEVFNQKLMGNSKRTIALFQKNQTML